MKWKKALTITAALAALLGGAALFKELAPDRYGLPEIELRAPGPTGKRIAADGLFGNYFPARAIPGPHPAVLLLGGSEGGLGVGAHQMALALQQEGFAVFHLAYFGAPGQTDALEGIPLELFDKGLDWLKTRPDVDPDRVAVMGASKGAEAALLVASRRPDLVAVVAGMPTSVAWNGVNWASGGQSKRASWTAGGKEVVTMPFGDWNQADGIISVYRTIEDPVHQAAAARAAIRSNTPRPRCCWCAAKRKPCGPPARCRAKSPREARRAPARLSPCCPTRMLAISCSARRSRAITRSIRGLESMAAASTAMPPPGLIAGRECLPF